MSPQNIKTLRNQEADREYVGRLDALVEGLLEIILNTL